MNLNHKINVSVAVNHELSFGKEPVSDNWLEKAIQRGEYRQCHL